MPLDADRHAPARLLLTAFLSLSLILTTLFLYHRC
jgi:hypothetical protein